MAQKIEYSDNLKKGTDKLNESIQQSNVASQKAITAEQTANQAIQQSESTQTQLDNIVIEGDSSVESAQARVDSKGESFPTLKSRLDNFEVSATQQLHDIAINVKSFGAKGDGVTDDTIAIQNASEYLHTIPKGGTLYFPDGEYLVSFTEQGGNVVGQSIIKPQSYENYLLSPNATIKVKPNPYNQYNIFLVENAHHVTIKGGTLLGDKFTHTGTDGEFGRGVFIKENCHNITVDGVNIYEFWGDGIEIGYYTSETKQLNTPDEAKDTYDIIIKNCDIGNNRRQGISVIYTYGLKVINCEIHDTGGTLPGAGIDLEPNYITTMLYNIEIIDCDFYGNQGSAIASMGGWKEKVVVEGCKFRKGTPNAALIKHLIINNCTIYDSVLSIPTGYSDVLEITNNRFIDSAIYGESDGSEVSNGEIYIEDNSFNYNPIKGYGYSIWFKGSKAVLSKLSIKRNSFKGYPSLDPALQFFRIVKIANELEISYNDFEINEIFQNNLRLLFALECSKTTLSYNSIKISSNVLINEYTDLLIFLNPILEDFKMIGNTIDIAPTTISTYRLVDITVNAKAIISNNITNQRLVRIGEYPMTLPNNKVYVLNNLMGKDVYSYNELAVVNQNNVIM